MTMMKKTNLKRLKKISLTSTIWINRQWKKSIKINHDTLERKRRSYFFIILIYKGKTRTSFRTEVQAAGVFDVSIIQRKTRRV